MVGPSQPLDFRQVACDQVHVFVSHAGRIDIFQAKPLQREQILSNGRLPIAKILVRDMPYFWLNSFLL